MTLRGCPLDLGTTSSLERPRSILLDMPDKRKLQTCLQVANEAPLVLKLLLQHVHMSLTCLSHNSSKRAANESLHNTARKVLELLVLSLQGCKAVLESLVLRLHKHVSNSGQHRFEHLTTNASFCTSCSHQLCCIGRVHFQHKCCDQAVDNGTWLDPPCFHIGNPQFFSLSQPSNNVPRSLSGPFRPFIL